MKHLNKVCAIILGAVLLTACSKKEDFSDFDQEVIIEDIEIGLVLRGASLRNQEVDFSVFDDQGNDFTENAIFFVNDSEISGNSFISSEIGTFQVYASYDNNGTEVTTPVQTFDVVIPKHKVVIEDHTGTWCGYCPRVTEAIEKVHDVTDDISIVAIHNNDEMTVSFENELRDAFQVFGFPTGRINRTTNWSPPYPEADVTSIAGEPSTMGIGISSSVDQGTLIVEVSVSSETELSGKKLVLYLVEDGIVAPQTNYLNNDQNSQYFGLGDPIEDFIHDDVLRASLTDPFGDAIASTPALEEFKATYTLSLSSNYDQDNLRLVAMVTEDDDTAINSQTAAINTVKTY